MTSSIKHIIFFILLIAQPIVAFGQSKVIVVTRKLEQKWEAKSGSVLFIKGGKARIIIEPSNTEYIEVQLKLKAKHANVEIAKKELKYLKYNLTKSGHEYYINNQILLPANISQPEARLEAEYILKVPDNCVIHIENNLGDIKISDLNSKLSIYQEYGNIYLQNMKGKLTINMKIGDIVAEDLNLDASIFSIYSEIKMRNINGEFNLQTKYGSLNIEPGIGLEKLKLDVNKTDISFINKACKEYKLDIETQYGGILFSESCYVTEKTFIEKTNHKGKLTELRYNRIEVLPEIIIKSKFATVSLQ